MADEDLHEELRRLYDELQQASADTSPDVQARLTHVRRELGELIERAEDLEEDRHASLRQRAEDALYEFEAEHPTLASALQHLLNTLNALGI